MDKEAAPEVLAALDEKRLSGAPLAPAEVLARMGVADARKKAFETIWLAAGDLVVAGLWAEQVCVGADGRWFCLETLDPQRRPDGSGPRAASQVQRAKDRLGLLKKAFDGGQTFRAVLQTNRIAIAEIESNRSAKLSIRVRDDEEWHVASWEPLKKLAVLVRGARGWLPSEADLQAAKRRLGMQDEAPAAAADGSPEGLRAAALAYVTRHFTGYGYGAGNVAGQALGYDIEVTDKKGETLLKVAVKGAVSAQPGVQLTDEERLGSVREPLWRLLLVSDPGTPMAQHKIYKASELPQVPGIESPA
jgi:hypothetical protein